MKELNLEGRKIPKVDKSICTHEQVIAYNMAIKDSDFLKKYIQGLNEQEKKKVFDERFKINLASISKDKFNIKIIYLAFIQNIEKYIEKPFIAWDYKQVGDFFKAYESEK